MQRPRLGVGAALAWTATQALWLHQGYRLEFWGESTFVPGLWAAGMLFFGANCWILGTVVSDIGRRTDGVREMVEREENKDKVSGIRT